MQNSTASHAGKSPIMSKCRGTNQSTTSDDRTGKHISKPRTTNNPHYEQHT